MKTLGRTVNNVLIGRSKASPCFRSFYSGQTKSQSQQNGTLCSKTRLFRFGFGFSVAAAASAGVIGCYKFVEKKKYGEQIGLLFSKPAICDDFHVSDARSNTINSNNRPFGAYTIADAVEVAAPALVNITTRVVGPWGQEGQSSGSGFIIDSNGLVATNAHVVIHSPTVKVTLHDGTVYNAKVHSMDKHTDIALVQITDVLEEPLSTIEFGDSTELRAGEWVIALGSPLGMTNSVTAGIVSSAARQASELGITQRRTDYIQTDAAINQGNSGGPLINLKGEVIGINTMKVAGTGGIGFAIPMETASEVIRQLRERGKVVRPYIGLRMMPLNPHIIARERAVASNFPAGVTSGLLVTSVTPNSPGAEAGLRSGDIIVSIDDKPVRTVHDLTRKMGYDIGNTHEIKIVRKDGTSATIRVATRGATLS